MSEETIKALTKKFTHRSVGVNYTVRTIGNNTVESVEKTHQVWLDIDHQHFKLAADCGTKKEAKWYQRQLAIALDRLLSKGACDE